MDPAGEYVDWDPCFGYEKWLDPGQDWNVVDPPDPEIDRQEGERIILWMKQRSKENL